MTTILLAHVTFYRWHKDTLQGTGRVSLKFANNLAVPLHGPDNTSDVAAALRYQDFVLGIMANPLFLGTQYPDSVLTTPGVNFTPLTDAQLALINGTADLWAFDPYVAQFASAPPGEGGIAACAAAGSASAGNPLWPMCAALGSTQANGWSLGAASHTYPFIAPQYVRQQLGYVWNTFRPSGGILVAEFGFPIFAEAEQADPARMRQDLGRTLYYQGFRAEMLRAVWEDGVNVVGALAWSVVDNNEFGDCESQFGLQAVDRADGMLRRTHRRSMFDFVDLFERHVAKKGK
jgi:beta-glucosidase/6-phospho-beta-glucosidase/beta-galactosidase